MLAGKVVIVTGAGRGIGREIAVAAARAGARLVVNDLGTESDGRGSSARVADEVVEAIRDTGGDAVANYDSVATMSGGQAIVSRALEAFGRIDVVVNNAGIARDRMIFNMSEEEFDAVIATNLKGTFTTIRAAAPHFKEQKSGRIINFTSTSGLIGQVGQANYAAAKMAVAGLTRGCALDMQRYNVTANCIAPFAYTRLIGAIPPEQAERIEKAKQLKAEHIPPLVVFLASDAAQGITGQIFSVRGKEVSIFSQPRPVHTIGRLEGWTAGDLARVLPGAFRSSLCPLDVSGSVFSWEPLT